MEDEARRTETQAHTAETTRAAGCESGGSVKLRPLTCERKKTMENGPEGPEKQAHTADPSAAGAVFTAAEAINIHMLAERDAVAAERERADIEDAFAPPEPIEPATDEESFRSGLRQHYRRVRQDVMRHLRDVYDFALWSGGQVRSPPEHEYAQRPHGEHRKARLHEQL